MKQDYRDLVSKSKMEMKTTDYLYNATTKTFTVSKNNLEPNKYTWLFRLVDSDGKRIEPFFVPLWVGEGVDFADFGWRDAFVYHIMTDRFLNGDNSNDVGNLPNVANDLEQWQGGDFRGIIQRNVFEIIFQKIVDK